MRLWVLILLLCGLASAHTVDYQIDGKQAVVATVRLGEEPASYSEYELFAPDSPETPFQLGRSDALGRIAFVPDKPGLWRLKVSADSQHGLHGTEMEIKVDETMIAELDSRPLVSTHTRLVVGISLLFGVFGLVSLLRSRKSNSGSSGPAPKP